MTTKKATPSAPNATADQRPKDDFSLLMTWDQLKTEWLFLYNLMSKGFKFGLGGPDHEHVPMTKISGRYEIRLYTKENVYCITVRPPVPGKDNGYMGCIASARTPLPGESWTRGSDLADGKCNADTWHDIMTDIVSFELVKLRSQKDFERVHEFAAIQRENVLTVIGEKT